MPAIARINDEVSGTCFQPGHGKGNPPQVCTGTIEEGSEDTLNSLGIARRGDSVQLNCIANHKTTITGGSSTVFVNRIAVARLGDSVGTGDDFEGSITSCSTDTNAGG